MYICVYTNICWSKLRLSTPVRLPIPNTRRVAAMAAGSGAAPPVIMEMIRPGALREPSSKQLPPCRTEWLDRAPVDLTSVAHDDDDSRAKADYAEVQDGQCVYQETERGRSPSHWNARGRSPSHGNASNSLGRERSRSQPQRPPTERARSQGRSRIRSKSRPHATVRLLPRGEDEDPRPARITLVHRDDTNDPHSTAKTIVHRTQAPPGAHGSEDEGSSEDGADLAPADPVGDPQTNPQMPHKHDMNHTTIQVLNMGGHSGAGLKGMQRIANMISSPALILGASEQTSHDIVAMESMQYESGQKMWECASKYDLCVYAKKPYCDHVSSGAA